MATRFLDLAPKEPARVYRSRDTELIAVEIKGTTRALGSRDRKSPNRTETRGRFLKIYFDKKLRHARVKLESSAETRQRRPPDFREEDNERRLSDGVVTQDV